MARMVPVEKLDQQDQLVNQGHKVNVVNQDSVVNLDKQEAQAEMVKGALLVLQGVKVKEDLMVPQDHLGHVVKQAQQGQLENVEHLANAVHLDQMDVQEKEVNKGGQAMMEDLAVKVPVVNQVKLASLEPKDNKVNEVNLDKMDVQGKEENQDKGVNQDRMVPKVREEVTVVLDHQVNVVSLEHQVKLVQQDQQDLTGNLDLQVVMEREVHLVRVDSLVPVESVGNLAQLDPKALPAHKDHEVNPAKEVNQDPKDKLDNLVKEGQMVVQEKGVNLELKVA